MFELNS
jgi:hypothetical protein